ncbi:MAG: glycoside hydrolase family 26 protein [Thermodesulfobacteriota bacterium]
MAMSARRPWIGMMLLLLAGLSLGARWSRGMLWGVGLEGNPLSDAQLNQAAEETGVRPGLVVFFLQWPADPGADNFPVASLDAIARQQALPCITWEPMHYQGGQETMIPAQQIVGGDYDRYLAAFARQAREWGRPVIIRFAHEMNTARYHWGTSRQEYGPASPAAYVAMFRHVVRVFRREGAHNVLWAFCPNAESIPHPLYDKGAGWNRAAAYFPGRGYVDVLGMDGYNWGTTRCQATHGWKSRWQSFAEIFSPLRDELTALAPDLPIVVFETASATEGGDKAAWLAQARQQAQLWGLAGISWFQVNKENDWRLQQGVGKEVVPLLGRDGVSAAQWLAGGLPGRGSQ